MVSSVRSIMLQATMVIVVLINLSTSNIVHGLNPCNGDQDCPATQYCYNISHICVDFTQCELHHRMEGPEPSRHPSHCGSCLPGYEEMDTPTPTCKQIEVLQKHEEKIADKSSWTGIIIGCAVVVPIVIIVTIVLLIRCNICPISQVSASGRFFEKVSFLTTRPTAPPQDDASYNLRGSSYPEEEMPPVYASVIRSSIDKEHLVNAVPETPPGWVRKPAYEPDCNDNVADGVAIPIHSSSTNLQMELEDEGETNPSTWTPGQVTVDLPARPFALFSNNEQEDNALNNVLMRGNCSSNSHEESTSNDSSERPEESSESRRHGGIYCGPNVQINQTITLNIAKNGTK